ncbi:Peptidyl-prolyl cis-trans isomerase fkbp4 [Bulinus truncatus]|nr:Peptidyl-prolyl cis-trans isomerase fkbp4 [Bulinus truncatus]
MSLDSSQSSDTVQEDCTVTLGQWISEKIVKKTRIKKGRTFIRPQLEAICDFVIDYNDCEGNDHSKEMNKSLSQIIGRKTEHKLGAAETLVMSGLEKLMMTMTEGEVSKFIVSPHDKCDDKSIVLTITLHKVMPAKPVWGLTSQEKYNLALHHKCKGSEHYQHGDIEAAFLQYSIAVKYLICMHESSVSSKQEKPMIQEHNALKTICYLNIAACHSKIDNHASVISSCTNALASDSQNVKGLYRRAQAYKATGRIAEARLDLKQALKIEPQNKAVYSLLLSSKKKNCCKEFNNLFSH